MLYPMIGIKMWVKVTWTFLREILIILKMEGMDHSLAPKSLLLKFFNKYVHSGFVNVMSDIQKEVKVIFQGYLLK